MDIKSNIEAALRTLCINEAYIIGVNTNERTLTHHLAKYLEKYFAGYSIDCEYNRNGDVPKRLMESKAFARADDVNGVTVYPDIVIHKRGVPPEGENYIIIEAKKEGVSYADDVVKLKLYKTQLGYKHAFMVVIPRGFNELTDSVDGFVIPIN